MTDLQIGIDLGGTKIAGMALNAGGDVLASTRVATPKDDYDGALDAIAAVVAKLETQAGGTGTVGVATPGSISPRTGVFQNANSTWLNGRSFPADLEAKLGRAVRTANDADCLALSEATDGAGKGHRTVFGVIVGTGCGGGIVHDGSLLSGPHSATGEWGHVPLPWARDDERPGPDCWCGQRSCLETWLSGTGLEDDYERAGGRRLTGEAIVTAAAGGDAAAQGCLDRHASRLGRGLAMIVNILDPDIVVLGGGLSQLEHLYNVVPALAAPYIFADHANLTLAPPVHGDASGARGAAWLWT
ncbi:Cryptic sugar kinase Mak [hydrothermal vent metagenome]|uniref:Cryptic sugar kinase Mak n=1 Tax=hydrothermal vent metagenome TaxID=652676 RepID=A0A3B0TT66_9ZZZZ